MIKASDAFLAANKSLQKRPIYLVIIAGYSRVFRMRVGAGVGEFDWITSIADLSLTIADLEGGANLGNLVFSVQDRGGAITADFPNFVFEGKQVVLRTGYVGMQPADFLTRFTGLISKVESSNHGLEYTFTCVDVRQELSRVIFALGDDGNPTDQHHPLTLNAHPLDILLGILRQELGLSDDQIDVEGIEKLRDFVFSGTQTRFVITSPPIARDFVEAELMKPLGCYHWPNALGQFCVNSFYPQSVAAPGGYGWGGYGTSVGYGGGGGGFDPLTAGLSEDNLTVIPLAEQSDLINQIAARFDTDGSKFFSEAIYDYLPSQTKYGLYGQQIIESQGLRAGLQGFFVARLTAFLLFLRYGNKALQFGVNSEITAQWSASLFEPGDAIPVSHSKVPDRDAGVMGLAIRFMEVLDCTYHFKTGLVSFRLIDLKLAQSFIMSRIAPVGQANFADADLAARARYMFMSGDDGKQSDGSPASTLS